MKILHLCNKKYYDTKMSRVRFHSIEALSKITFVKMSGIGYNDYNNELSVQENIDNFDIHFDLVIAYKPNEMKDFGKINIPKCIRYNEMYDVNCRLWELEDRIRILGESENLLVGPSKQVIEFIETSKSIYSTNDNRYKVKRKINEIWKSHIMEVKSYAHT